MTLKEPNMSRDETYKILAALFHEPDKTLLEAVREIGPLAEGARAADLESLRREHLRLFTPTVAGGLPPYEMEYGKFDIFLKTQMMADVAGFYLAFGLDLTESSHERVDFISAELEFMHWLLKKEDHAREKGDGENEGLCRETARKFLKDHLGRWASYFGGTMVSESRLPFYQNLGRWLAQFVEDECRTMGISPEKVAGRRPEPEGSPEGSEEDLSCSLEGGCLVDDHRPVL